MNPFIESLVRKIYFYHHRLFRGPKNKVITYRKCIKNLIVYRGIGYARAKINLGTLDILQLRGRLQGREEEINRRIIDRKISSINQRNEFRSFFYFLQKEFPKDYPEIPFVKRERPDFLVRDKNRMIGVEITEAIDTGDAQQRTRIYKSKQRGRKSRDIEKSVDQMPGKLSKESATPLEELICQRVMDKTEKFRDFYRGDQEVLIIIANHREFQTGKDYERIRKRLERSRLLQKAPFRSVIVMNLIDGAYAHYQGIQDRIIIKRRPSKG